MPRRKTHRLFQYCPVSESGIHAYAIIAARPSRADPASLGVGWDGGVDGDAVGVAAERSACWVSVRDADTAGAALSVLRDDAGFCGDAAWGEAGSESMLVGCCRSGVWCVSGRSAGGMAQTATEFLSRCSCEVWSHGSAGDHAGAEQSALREGILGNSGYQIFGYLIAAAVGFWVYTDAKKRGMNAVGWGIGAALLCIVILPLYLITRKPVLGAGVPGLPPGAVVYTQQPPPPPGMVPPPPPPGMAPPPAASAGPVHFCVQCGQKYEGTVKFCPVCGATQG